MTANRSGRSEGKRPRAVVLAQREPVVRVLLGDADPLAGQAVTELLSRETNVAIIGCESGALALTCAVEKCSPAVLVVDVGQQQFSGAGLVAQWIAACGHVVVLTSDLTFTEARGFLRAGVRGVIDKADVSLLGAAVRAAAAGQVFVAPTVSTPIVDHWRAAEASAVGAPTVAALPVPAALIPPGGPLTRRERAVLTLMAAGHSSDEAAQQLGVSTGTLQGHMHQVLAKLKVKDRTQAVAWAYLSGLCTVPGR